MNIQSKKKKKKLANLDQINYFIYVFFSNFRELCKSNQDTFPMIMLISSGDNIFIFQNEINYGHHKTAHSQKSFFKQHLSNCLYDFFHYAFSSYFKIDKVLLIIWRYAWADIQIQAITYIHTHIHTEIVILNHRKNTVVTYSYVGSRRVSTKNKKLLKKMPFSSVMFNSISSLLGHRMPRYLAKRYSWCFSEGVFGWV